MFELTATYLIFRHSGRNNSPWKIIYSSNDKQLAKEKFDKEKILLRQGGLKIIGPDIEEGIWAPRLRTKW